MDIEKLKELRSAIEPGCDDRETALSLLKPDGTRVCQKVRSAPCSDCAVVHGLYTGLAACGYRHLSVSERWVLADRWHCHNGGRCEGAAIVLLD